MDSIPYGRQWIDEDDIQAVSEVLRGELVTQGPMSEKFEQELCRLTGAKYCVVLANGTAALHLAVAAFEIEKGAEGITSPNTFIATPNSLIYNGIKPVFADIDPRTFNITPDSVRKKLNKKTKVVIPVHFAGQSADIKGIRNVVGKDAVIIEDAAHAIGSFDMEGNPVGSCKYSDAVCLSFHPVKTITSGEGGAIMTNNPEIYERLIQLRIGGTTKKPQLLAEKNPGPWYYEMLRLGFNYRMTDFQAALGLSQLKKLDKFIARRNKIIAAYNKELSGLRNVVLPWSPEGLKSAYHLYVTRIDFKSLGMGRADFINTLISRKIGTQVHYIPVHLQPYYRKNFGCKQGDLPFAEAYYEQALSLPLYPKMTDEQTAHVIKNFKELVNK